jgi:hypothetical protein
MKFDFNRMLNANTSASAGCNCDSDGGQGSGCDCDCQAGGLTTVRVATNLLVMATQFLNISNNILF